MVEIKLGHYYYWICKQSRMISFMITTGPLNSQDMIRIVKQSKHDFSGNIYVMDIMWILCDVHV